MAGRAPDEDFSDNLKGLRERLGGIEREVASVLYVLSYAQLSYYLSHNRIVDRLSDQMWSKAANRTIELYVIACLVITAINWWRGPWLLVTVACSYFTVSTIITFLQVLFLRKIFGDVESPERSLILFFCNVAQIVFMFAAWYVLVGSYSKENALFYSMLVLVTAGYPTDVGLIVGLQIATDLVLLAVFLAYILGKLGKSIRSEPHG
jgi:hypothetical protein